MITFLKVSLIGILSATLAILAEQMVAIFAELFFHQEIVLNFYDQLSLSLIIFALVEELLKYGAIRYVLRNNLRLSGIGYVLSAALVGLWWGFFESFLVIYSRPDYLSGPATANYETIFSMLSVGAVHFLTATFMGIMISSRLPSQKNIFLKAFAFPLLVHLLFNFLIIQKSNFTNWMVAAELLLVFSTNIIFFVSNRRHLD